MFRAARSLQGRLFWWFGATIIVTGFVVVGVGNLTAPPRRSWQSQVQHAHALAVTSFAHIWSDAEARDGLAHAIASELDMGIVLEDMQGQRLSAYGRSCSEPWFSEVRSDAGALGRVGFCPDQGKMGRGALSFAAILAAALVLVWLSSGLIARRLARPFAELVRVAKEIGDGKLDTRMRMGRHLRGAEAEVLATAINDMASRIEKQLLDQRELLAAVSHEVRSPLARMRLLIEMLRDKHAGEKNLDELEREVLEVDALVDQLLANSRLEFTEVKKRPMSALELARTALERSGCDVSRLDATEGDVDIGVDPTLVARALANLIANAMTHGGGVVALRMTPTRDSVRFEVDDDGPGFSEEDRERAFESFYRGASHGGRGTLGLGLALVKRIAEAHGGTVWADNRAPLGARVGFSIAR